MSANSKVSFYSAFNKDATLLPWYCGLQCLCPPQNHLLKSTSQCNDTKVRPLGSNKIRSHEEGTLNNGISVLIRVIREHASSFCTPPHESIRRWLSAT